MLTSAAMRAVDVLHILYLRFWPDKRVSMVKIVENLIENIEGLRQASVPTPRDVDFYANAMRPGILHIHYSGHHPENVFLDRLDYSPHIVHTVHASQTSIFSERASRIVCISRLGMEQNDPAKSAYIENSVDVSGIAKHRPNDNGACLALRFSPNQMQPETMDLLSRIPGPVYVYGEDAALALDPAHNDSVLLHASRHPNVHILPYCNYLECVLARYSFFAYYIANNDPERCYGMGLMEAVSLGMPVVAVRRRQDSQEWVRDGYNGFIADNDEEFIERCTRLVEDRDLYLRMCENAAAHRETVKNLMPRLHRELYLSLI